MDFNNSKTKECLQKAYAGESAAYTRYILYAQKAAQQNLPQYEMLFYQTAKNELAHAQQWLWLLEKEGLPDTVDNLAIAAAGEHYEYSEMYPEFARQAREEGFNELAVKFENVAKIEQYHKERYEQMQKAIIENTLFEKSHPIHWVCQKCGFICESTTAPQKCPVCGEASFMFAADTPLLLD